MFASSGYCLEYITSTCPRQQILGENPPWIRVVGRDLRREMVVTEPGRVGGGEGTPSWETV